VTFPKNVIGIKAIIM